MPKSEKPQDFSNHVRFDPMWHFLTVPIFLLTMIFQVVRTVRNPTLWNGWLIVAAIGALAAVLLIRIYSLRVQDRVIRLEERLRLILLDSDGQWSTRAADLTVSQMTALRFASDAEVGPLARRALAEKLGSKQIKQAIAVWRPDFHRV